jgi:hypothetical protein
MKESEYILATDLAKLRIADNAMRSTFCAEEPNKTRQLSILANLGLMIADLEKKVDKSVTG